MDPRGSDINVRWCRARHGHVHRVPSRSDAYAGKRNVRCRAQCLYRCIHVQMSGGASSVSKRVATIMATSALCILLILGCSRAAIRSVALQQGVVGCVRTVEHCSIAPPFECTTRPLETRIIFREWVPGPFALQATVLAGVFSRCSATTRRYHYCRDESRVVAELLTGADGCFRQVLPEGNYSFLVATAQGEYCQHPQNNCRLAVRVGEFSSYNVSMSRSVLEE